MPILTVALKNMVCLFIYTHLKGNTYALKTTPPSFNPFPFYFSHIEFDLKRGGITAPLWFRIDNSREKYGPPNHCSLSFTQMNVTCVIHLI